MKSIRITLIFFYFFFVAYSFSISPQASSSDNNTNFPPFIKPKSFHISNNSFCNSIIKVETFSQSQRDRATNVRNFLKKLHSANYLVTYIEYESSHKTFEEFFSQYQITMLPYSLFGILLFSIAAVLFIIYLCNFKKLKTYFEEAEEKRTCLVITIIVSSGILITITAFGLSFANKLNMDINQTFCASQNLFSNLQDGDFDKKWVGLESLTNNFTQLYPIVDTAIKDITDIENNHSQLDTFYTQLGKQIESYYTNSENKQVINPRGYGMLTPIFVQQLGPTSNENTHAGKILKEAQKKNDLVIQSLEKANNSIADLKENSDLIKSSLKNAAGSYDNLTNSLDTVNNDITSRFEKVMRANYLFTDVLFGFFLSSIILTSIVILLALNSVFFEYNCLKKGYRLSCCTHQLLILLAFLITASGFPFLMVTLEVCETAQKTTTSQTFYKTITTNLLTNNKEILSYSDICLFQDGDFLKELGLSAQLSDLNKLNELIITLNKEIIERPDSETIPVQNQTIRLINTGKVFSNPEVESCLKSLNLLTNFQRQGSYQSCAESIDTWYLSSVNCTSNDGKVFKATELPVVNYKKPTCIGFDKFKAYNATDRYNETTFKSCPKISGQDYVEYTATYVQAFQNHFADVNTVFKKLQTDLNTLNKTNIKFVNESRNLFDSLINVSGDSLKIIEVIGNSQTGLYLNSNCSFLKGDMELVVDHFCINYLSHLAYIVLLAFLFGVLGLILACPLAKIERVERNRFKKKNKELESLLKLGDLYEDDLQE